MKPPSYGSMFVHLSFTTLTIDSSIMIGTAVHMHICEHYSTESTGGSTVQHDMSILF